MIYIQIFFILISTRISRQLKWYIPVVIVIIRLGRGMRETNEVPRTLKSYA